MSKYLIFIILILGILVRLIDLAQFPPSLNWDEVSLGYNAYSLLLSGRDEWGTAFPTIFRAYGDYKLPVYVYAAVLPVKLLGLNELVVRLPSALAGSLAIAAAYVLAWRVFRLKAVAWLAALLLALAPWTLFLSHLAVEANLAVLLITLGLALLVSRRYFLSVLFFGLSVWAYNSARLFVPLLLFGYFFLHRHSFSRRTLAYCLVPLAVFFLPMVWSLFTSGGQSRARWLNILDSGSVARIENLRNASSLPAPLPRLIYNRPVYFALTAAGNYFKYFSPDFLFIRGGNHYQFSVQDYGLLYLIDLPFFYLGVILILRSKTINHKSLIILWLLLAPLPGSLVRDAPHTLRAVTFLPLPMLISAYAIWRTIYRWRPFLIVYLLVVFVSFSLYARRALTVYGPSFSPAFQYGYKQLVQYIKEEYDSYDEIIVTKRWAEPHEFILFYWPWNPGLFRSDPQLVRYGRSDWFWVDAFAKFRFINDWEMVDTVAALPPGKKYLIVASPEANTPLPEQTRINFLDGSPAFIITTR